MIYIRFYNKQYTKVHSIHQILHHNQISHKNGSWIVVSALILNWLHCIMNIFKFLQSIYIYCFKVNVITMKMYVIDLQNITIVFNDFA